MNFFEFILKHLLPNLGTGIVTALGYYFYRKNVKKDHLESHRSKVEENLIEANATWDYWLLKQKREPMSKEVEAQVQEAENLFYKSLAECRIYASNEMYELLQENDIENRTELVRKIVRR